VDEAHRIGRREAEEDLLDELLHQFRWGRRHGGACGSEHRVA
jgi:hypothetical protein